MSVLPLIALITLVASAAGAIWFAGRRAAAAGESVRAALALQETTDAQDRMLGAARDRPSDSHELAHRVRDGSF